MISVFYLDCGIYIILLAFFVVTGNVVLKDCYKTTPSNYDGHKNTTHSGTPCVRWDSLGIYHINDQFPDATVSEAANFCRSMEGDDIWCWTDLDEWDSCGIAKCDVVIDCYSTTPEMYDGHQHTTRDGKPCLWWDSDIFSDDLFPDATVSDAANFCRAVYSDDIVCLISSQPTELGKCGITKCDNNRLSKCGTLKIEEPVFLGRNVSFVFTPDFEEPNAILEWQLSREKGPWITSPLTYKFTQYFENGTYFMTLTDSTHSDEAKYRIHYYNESMHCYMEITKLVINDHLEINFDIFGSTLNVTEGAKTQVKCSAENVPVLNITWIEESDEGNMIRNQCYSEPECVIGVHADAISKRKFVCAMGFFQYNASKVLTVNINPSEVPKQTSDEESDESTIGTTIGIIIGASATFVVISITIVIVNRKMRSKIDATSNRKNEANIDSNDERLDNTSLL